MSVGTRDHDHGYYACQDHFRWCRQRKQAPETGFPASKISTSTPAPVSQTSRRVLMLQPHAGVGVIYWPILKPTGQDLQPQHRQHTPRTLAPYLCDMPRLRLQGKDSTTTLMDLALQANSTTPFWMFPSLRKGGNHQVRLAAIPWFDTGPGQLRLSGAFPRSSNHLIVVRGLRWTLPSSPRAYALEGVRFSAACVWAFVLCMLGET
ncbi:hypothetical protein BKA70DRAFT_852556 [Coprinopsis sp. MPI-PUGE-AT-0042]|nr:hypothetical protein BKA70DRAFT_852556 [Coprinopsis sp. MPI-PUGE-AT-0042]